MNETPKRVTRTDLPQSFKARYGKRYDRIITLTYQGKSVTELAKQFNLCQGTISCMRREAGIPRAMRAKTIPKVLKSLRFNG